MADFLAGRYLVTGGAGFIGSHLCDQLLATGRDVVVLDDLSSGHRRNLDPRVELAVGDVADAAVVRRVVAGVDGVFHLAAIASVVRGTEDWPGTHRVNQGGTVAVLDAARTASRDGRPVPVVFASSAAVYGDIGDALAEEGRRPMPMTAYGADKLGCELHARVAALVHGVPTLGLRFFNVYGPRQDAGSPYSGVISLFARRIAAAERIVLHGGGGQTRDFIHVRDVVRHLLAAMARLEHGGDVAPVLNVCTGRAVSVHALAAMLAALSGRALLCDPGPVRAGDIGHSCGSVAAAGQALGLRAEVTLEAGLTTLGIAPVSWTP